jgi:hypothetical protein
MQPPVAGLTLDKTSPAKVPPTHPRLQRALHRLGAPPAKHPGPSLDRVMGRMRDDEHDPRGSALSMQGLRCHSTLGSPSCKSVTSSSPPAWVWGCWPT